MQGYTISGGTNFYTQLYLLTKKSIQEKRFAYEEFKWKDFAFAAFISGPIGGVLTGGLGADFGTPGYIAGYSTAATLYVGNEYRNEPQSTPLNQLTSRAIDYLEDILGNNSQNSMNSLSLMIDVSYIVRLPIGIIGEEGAIAPIYERIIR